MTDIEIRKNILLEEKKDCADKQLATKISKRLYDFKSKHSEEMISAQFTRLFLFVNQPLY